MLKYTDYDIVFQEIPDEVTLAINLSNCPHKCKGCHSPQLWLDIGEVLTETVISNLLNKYGNLITCVCFMGGDANPFEVEKLSVFIKRQSELCIKTAWYSGCEKLNKVKTQNFDYIKLGSYKQELGGLKSLQTNQRLYKVKDGLMHDITELMRR